VERVPPIEVTTEAISTCTKTRLAKRLALSPRASVGSIPLARALISPSSAIATSH